MQNEVLFSMPMLRKFRISFQRVLPFAFATIVTKYLKNHPLGPDEAVLPEDTIVTLLLKPQMADVGASLKAVVAENVIGKNSRVVIAQGSEVGVAVEMVSYDTDAFIWHGSVYATSAEIHTTDGKKVNVLTDRISIPSLFGFQGRDPRRGSSSTNSSTNSSPKSVKVPHPTIVRLPLGRIVVYHVTQATRAQKH